MSTPAEFARLWQELRAVAADSQFLRARLILSSSAAESFAAIRNVDGMTAVAFRLRNAVAPSARFRFQTEGLAYFRVPDTEDGVVLVGVVEEQAQPGDLFAVLAADLARHVGDGTIAGAGERLSSRLLHWQNALKSRRDMLSREAQIGLAGELQVLVELANDLGAVAAVDAWKGAEGGLHDFTRTGIAVEVKALAGSHQIVPISTLDQLDRRGLRRLVVARVRFVEDPAGHSLVEMVGSARRAAGSAELERKLALAGWRDADGERYQDHRLRFLGMEYFDVGTEFPALTRETVPDGISEAAYRIDVRSLASFRLDDGAIAELKRDMAGTIGG